MARSTQHAPDLRDAVRDIVGDLDSDGVKDCDGDCDASCDGDRDAEGVSEADRDTEGVAVDDRDADGVGDDDRDAEGVADDDADSLRDGVSDWLLLVDAETDLDALGLGVTDRVGVLDVLEVRLLVADGDTDGVGLPLRLRVRLGLGVRDPLDDGLRLRVRLRDGLLVRDREGVREREGVTDASRSTTSTSTASSAAAARAAYTGSAVTTAWDSTATQPVPGPADSRVITAGVAQVAGVNVTAGVDRDRYGGAQAGLDHAAATEAVTVTSAVGGRVSTTLYCAVPPSSTTTVCGVMANPGSRVARGHARRCTHHTLTGGHKHCVLRRTHRRNQQSDTHKNSGSTDRTCSKRPAAAVHSPPSAIAHAVDALQSSHTNTLTSASEVHTR
jgi:hypothetical protein